MEEENISGRISHDDQSSFIKIITLRDGEGRKFTIPCVQFVAVTLCIAIQCFGGIPFPVEVE